MAYESFCASCTYMGTECDYEGKYNCDKQWERVYATDSRCGRYCEAYRRSDSCRANLYDNSKSHTSGGCYLTTITCDILGAPDNNAYLKTLRYFRNEYMQKDASCQGLLLRYDTVGPLIADRIWHDPQRLLMAHYCFDRYISKAVKEIQRSEYTEAIETYTDMTNSLIKYYQIEEPHMEVSLDNIDKNYLGHGKIRKLIKKEENQL